ncbi:MAG: TetR/AcrR family transcriptional regulator [Acinetobacter sp.]
MPRNAAKPRETYHVGNLEPQLLIQAKRMLEEVGPTKISIRAIAEQLGVSATAVYYHFANKDELEPIGCNRIFRIRICFKSGFS